MTEKDDNQKPVSVAIITKNEEERLPDCLKSLSFADDVLVVDSGSKDKTTEVAESYGARVLIESWRGFSHQKQFAVEQCLHDWVLILDADERIPGETADVIGREMSRTGQDIAAYSFRRKNTLRGRWIRYCGWWPDRIVRLVDRRKGRFDGRSVHEKWDTMGNEKALDAVIEHFSFRSYSDLIKKMNQYSDIAARDLYAGKTGISPLTPISHGLWMFLKCYLFELGILEGFDGFVISLTSAGGSFLKYAKLYERIKNKRAGV